MISIERHSYWKDLNRAPSNLHWSESFPSRSPMKEDRNECGCTVHVAKRPEGVPDSRHLKLLYETGGGHHDENRVSFNVSSRWLVFGLQARTPHTYFTFDPKQNRVHIEIVRRIEGSRPPLGMKRSDWSKDDKYDYCFLNLHLGTEIDTSRFFNGHSPSRIFPHWKPQLNANSLWIHNSGWKTGEEIRVVSPTSLDIVFWIKVFELVAEFRALDAVDPNDSLESLHARVSSPTLDRCEALVNLLEPFTRSFRDTQVFQTSIGMEG